MKEKKVVIFGASGGGVKVFRTLMDIDISIEFFVDNDKNKWGNILEGKEIKDPKSLIEDEYNIIIASDYQPEIEKQLQDMEIINKLALKEEYIMRYAKDHIHEFDYLKELKIGKHSKNIIFGLEEGMWLGGIETWTFMLAEEFQKMNWNVNIFSKVTEDRPPKYLEDKIVYFDLGYCKYWKSISELVKVISENLPCTVIDNWQSQILIATAIIKHFHPDKIKCISILHNDKIVLYRKTAYMEQYINSIAGVSRTVVDHMKKDFHVDDNKLFYKESPVEYDETLVKNYSLSKNKPIQIGYAARITKTQKRSDLLIPLIEGLEKIQTCYHIYIAGIGDYFDTFSELIKEKKLEKNVTIHGLLPREKMSDFWKEKDIFINLSDYEGVGLSMLEAMSYGAVPIVTDVAGAREFVTDGENGYVCNVRDINAIIENIDFLNRNRACLQYMGEKSRVIIKDKCNKANYLNYIENLAEFI